MESLCRDDIVEICKEMYPNIMDDTICNMVDFNTRLHDDIAVHRKYGANGGPGNLISEICADGVSCLRGTKSRKLLAS